MWKKLYGVKKKKKKLMKGVEKLIIGVKWELEVSALLSSCVVRNARVKSPFLSPFSAFLLHGLSYPEFHESLTRNCISLHTSNL